MQAGSIYGGVNPGGSRALLEAIWIEEPAYDRMVVNLLLNGQKTTEERVEGRKESLFSQADTVASGGSDYGGLFCGLR